MSGISGLSFDSIFPSALLLFYLVLLLLLPNLINYVPCPAGLPKSPAAEAELLARGNNNTEQAVQDHIYAICEGQLRSSALLASQCSHRGERKEEEISTMF